MCENTEPCESTPDLRCKYHDFDVGNGVPWLRNGQAFERGRRDTHGAEHEELAAQHGSRKGLEGGLAASDGYIFRIRVAWWYKTTHWQG